MLLVKPPHDSCSVHLHQMPSTGQQDYPSHSPRRNGRNGNDGSGDPPGNGKHYPIDLVVNVVVPMTPPGGVDGGPQDDPYRLGQKVPHLLHLEGNADIIDVHSGMSNLNRV